MLSPTYTISPQITLFQPPHLYHIQLPKPSTPRKNFKTTKNCDQKYIQNPSLTTHLPNVSISQENPGSAFLDNSSSTQLGDSNVLASQLQACCTVKEVRKLHAIAIKCLKSSGTFVDNNLISSYARFGDLVEARKVFDEMSIRNVVSWTAILNGYLRSELDDEALLFFREFIESGVRANCETFVCLGKQIHACIIKDNCSNLVVDSSIVYLYAKCGDLVGAFRVFDRMPNHDVVSWTTIITACSQLGWGEDAFLLFSRMLLEGFAPNEFTVCSVLNACGDEEELKFGRQLHGTIVKKIFKNDVFIGTSLVDMYAKCGEIADSTEVFDGMRRRNTVTWTSIIAGLARNGLGEEAISLFRIKKRRNIYVNNLTMVSILRACGSVGGLLLGKELYCKCKEYSLAS
ncbi:hypothetical protein CsSME_00014404 [Camellia sinensis var. sinensis]